MRKMKMVMLIIVVAFIFSGVMLWAGPKRDAGNAASSVQELTMLCHLDGNTPDTNNYSKKAIEEKFNVSLKLEVGGSEAAYAERLRLLISANDLPDIMDGFSVPDAKSAGMRGMLVAFNDYKNIMPNYYEWMNKDPKIFRNISAENGKVYSAPRYDMFLRVNRVPTMRVDLLEELGIPIPTTFDELYVALKRVKEKYPDNLGMFSNTGYSDLTTCWGFYFNTNVGYSTTSGMYYDRYQDKWVYGPSNAGYLELITYFNKLWNEGLIDPEYLTTKSSQDKYLKGNVLVTCNTDDSAWKSELQHLAANPGSKLNYEIVAPFRSKSMPEQAVSMRQYVNSGWSWSVSAKTKDPELACKIVDWLYSTEGSYKLTAGEEGVHYTFVEQNGNKVWKYVPEIMREYNPDGKQDPRLVFNLRHPYWMRLNRDYFEEFMPDNDFIITHNATLENMYKLSGYERGNDNIELSFTDDQYAEMSQLVLNLQTLVDESTQNFIIGRRPLSEHSAFLADLDKLGRGRLEAIYADAYAKWKNTAQ